MDEELFLQIVALLGYIEHVDHIPTSTAREMAKKAREELTLGMQEQQKDTQEDLRRELLRFVRFVRDQGYALTTVEFYRFIEQTYEAGIIDVTFEDLVERSLQADSVDWFAEAQKAGYAQDGGQS